LISIDIGWWRGGDVAVSADQNKVDEEGVGDRKMDREGDGDSRSW
jgi:hypothetical protein